MTIRDLPNDIDELKRFFIEEIQKKDLEINKKDRQLNEKDQLITDLKDTILLLQRKKFAPTSEKSDPKQLNLFNELEDIVEESTPLEDENKTTKVGEHERKKRGKRAPLSDSLPRIDDIIDLSESEKEGMELIGEEISEKLEITPAKVFVRRIIRKKYKKIDGKKTEIKIADKRPELLPKSYASGSLIAYIITAKYCDALPLYRQETILKRVSADLTRQTMARWLIKVADKLMPLYNLLQEKLLESDYIQMDETRVQVLKEKNKKATSKSYMWVRHSPGESPIILFDYDPSRSGQVPIDLLEGFRGFLQVDEYDGYSSACEKYKLDRVGCWDHCRRKFFDASKTSNGKGVGKKGLDKINKLYKIEKEIQHQSVENKYKVRQEKSLPILNDLKEWINETREKITPNSTGGKAINYCYNEWNYLVRYIDDGRLNISNAWVENGIRPFCIGRKNWLFSASVEGAKASAIYYSLVQIARLNEIDPFDFLSKMLEKLPLAETVEDFEKLLPLKGQFRP